MKTTGMPADRLTADYIWNSFQNSGKQHLILTGSRGSGKTTLLNELFPETVPGITTWAEPGCAVFLRENISGQTVQVGVFEPDLPGPGNQMVPLQDGFASLGVFALKKCMESDSPWITIDEIGYLENKSDVYQNALQQLMAEKQVAAVIRKQELPFLQKLCGRKDCFVVDLDDVFGRIGCVIMASGFGRRFGGNKLMADFYGEPLFCRILDATEGIFTQRVVVTRYEEIARLCENRGVQVVLHNLPHLNDTVRLGLEAMNKIDRCMFATADQPFLQKETIASLAAASADEPDLIWRTICEGTYGSPVIFPQWAFPELRNLPEGKGGGAVIKKYPERLRTVNVRDRYELMDIDTPEELKKMLER